MTPKFRIRKTKEGWIVEYYHEYKLFFIKKRCWKPYITYLGLKEAFTHISKQYAWENLLFKLKNDLRRNDPFENLH